MIDLHSHTFFSDGTLSPEELIDKALKKGITHLAITDHDTCRGLKPALDYSKDKDIHIIPGIEIEVDFKPGEFHLLGLNLDWEKGPLNEKIETIILKRNERNQRLISKMAELGYHLDYSDVEAEAEGLIIARPHFARAMIKKGWVKTVQEAFEKFLGPGKPFYTPKEALPLEEALDLIHRSGGKSVLAHPLSLYLSWGKIGDRIKTWRDMGLQGIEAWHSGARLVDANRLQHIADDLGMFVTGGSDYHGKNRLNRQLGYGPGRTELKEEWLDAIL